MTTDYQGAPPQDRTSRTDDERIKNIMPLPPPEHLIKFFPIQGTPVESLVADTRHRIQDILHGKDDRLLVIIGPCSIHDPQAAVEYARTTESQVHRELASGISAPIGFKNGTDGNVKIALDAIQAAGRGHHFLSVHKNGQVATVETKGNKDCHIILRGGKGPNYDAESVAAAVKELEGAKLPQKLMIDFSHANSSKQYARQVEVARDVAGQLAAGSQSIFGVMIESHLKEGAQKFTPGKDDASKLTYGQSITDACIGWEASTDVLGILADAVKARRKK
jgi:3-deoxy-D-arabino-heptulosonate 7-phosphate (DAHP) synthase